MNKHLLLLVLVCQTICLFGWGGPEASGEKAILFGKLTSQEGQTFNVTNITIGRSRTAGRIERLYEMPRVTETTKGKDTIMISGNPHYDLTTTELDLLKVKKIEVPYPQTMWVWEKPSNDSRPPATRYQFIELQITWKGDQTKSYLLELGTEHTSTPVKIFCDSTGDNPITAGTGDGSAMFCAGVNQDELRKKGAPFPAIKQLIIEGHCYEAPKGSPHGAGIVKTIYEPSPVPADTKPAEPEPVAPTSVEVQIEETESEVVVPEQAPESQEPQAETQISKPSELPTELPEPEAAVAEPQPAVPAVEMQIEETESEVVAPEQAPESQEPKVDAEPAPAA